MDDFFTPPPKFDPARSPPPVEPIGDKHGDQKQQKPFDQDPEKRQRLINGSLLLFFKKVFATSLFSRGSRGSKAPEEIAQAAQTIKEHLEMLKTSDQNENPHFIEELSIAYLTLSSIPPGSRFDAFLQAANAYPQGDAHSFAFYLANHAGDTWLPFPFLEILRKLHQGYILRKKNSELQRLIDLLQCCS